MSKQAQIMPGKYLKLSYCSHNKQKLNKTN